MAIRCYESFIMTRPVRRVADRMVRPDLTVTVMHSQTASVTTRKSDSSLVLHTQPRNASARCCVCPCALAAAAAAAITTLEQAGGHAQLAPINTHSSSYGTFGPRQATLGETHCTLCWHTQLDKTVWQDAAALCHVPPRQRRTHKCKCPTVALAHTASTQHARAHSTACLGTDGRHTAPRRVPVIPAQVNSIPVRTWRPDDTTVVRNANVNAHTCSLQCTHPHTETACQTAAAACKAQCNNFETANRAGLLGGPPPSTLHPPRKKEQERTLEDHK